MFVQILGREVPVYGMMIVTGVLLANVIAFWRVKKVELDTDYFLVLEAYCILGAFVGAKLLFVFTSFNRIQWDQIGKLQYFNALMQGGFVFYGGLAGGIFLVLLAGKIHKINAETYLKQLIFLIPLIHAFGRIGCHKVGCCYGIPYSGIGAITYPEGFLAPKNISLFPVQAVEACLLILISGILLVLSIKKLTDYTAPVYFILYAVVRFFLEFFRGDEIRGRYGGMTTSQWISIILFVSGFGLLITKKSGKIIDG